jgi:hypothetical protein
MKLTYQIRWKEELVGTYGDHSFIVEITMGKLHVYFPVETRWEVNAPPWAAGKWAEVRDATREWAERENIPFTVDQTARVDFLEPEEHA